MNCSAIETVAPYLSMKTKLKVNKKRIEAKDFISLATMLVPGVGFGCILLGLASFSPRFSWLLHPSLYPWQLHCIAVTGSIATIGGIGDWMFHRIYVAVGPAERKSHLLALASGGLPLFLFMILASASRTPEMYLIPIIISVLYTTVLICFDEFVFHYRRCGWFETVMHRFLVLGNGCAWLAWMHWIYVSGGLNA